MNRLGGTGRDRLGPTQLGRADLVSKLQAVQCNAKTPPCISAVRSSSAHILVSVPVLAVQ